MRPQPSHMCRFCRRGVLCLITRQHTLISLGIHRRTQLITPCTTPAVPGSRVPVEKPSLCQACSVEGSWTEAWGTRASTPQLLQIAVVSSVVSMETDICGLPRQCTHTAPTGSCNSAAKLFVAFHFAFDRGLEVYIKNTIPNVLSTMRALGVVVSNPRPCDVMQMINTEAHQVIQTFTFQGTDERFTECIGLWRSYRRFDRGDILVFPERFHRVGILSITITKEELYLKSFTFEPH